MKLTASADYLLVCIDPVLMPDMERHYKVQKTLNEYLKSSGIKRRYKFPDNASGLKRCLAKIETLKTTLKGFPDIRIHQSKGFSLSF